MYKYAQLDAVNIIVGISQLSGEVDANNMIFIGDKEVTLGSSYNRETSEFTEPIPVEPQPTIEEKILAENQYQTMLLELNSAGGA